jgi:protein ImuB
MVEPDTVLLDATGLGRVFGSERNWAEQLVAHFERQGDNVRLAVADTLGAAWAVARFHPAFIIHRSSLLLIPPDETADHSRRAGACTHAPGHGGCKHSPYGRAAADALRLLPIEALRLPERTVGLLHELGIDLIDQLAALPREDLTARFGPELLRRWDQALGRVAESIPAYRPPTPLTATWDFEPPTRRRATIDAALERLVERLTDRLRATGRGTAGLTCRLVGQPEGDHRPEPLTVSVGLYRPTAGRDHLLGLLRLQLERQRMSAPVMSAELSIDRTAPLTAAQPTLLPEIDADDRLAHRRRALSGLIDRLASRLGAEAVLGIRLLPDAQPERAWKGRPLVEGAAPTRRAEGVSPRVGSALSDAINRASPRPSGRGYQQTPVVSSTRENDLPPRPLRLFSRPRPLSVIATEHGPTQLDLAGRPHGVAEAVGPERIETGWWRGRIVRRDYYRVTTTDGRRWWLFQRRENRRWFLHGVFE